MQGGFPLYVRIIFEDEKKIKTSVAVFLSLLCVYVCDFFKLSFNTQ